MSRVVETTTSFPILGLLTLIFVTLRLTGHIDWSWWWVTSPLWLPIVGVVVGVTVVALIVKVYRIIVS